MSAAGCNTNVECNFGIGQIEVLRKMLGRLIRLSPLLLVPQLGVGSDVNDGSNDYDFFLFAQMWPTSVCNEWIEKSADNTCTIRKYKVFKRSKTLSDLSFQVSTGPCTDSGLLRSKQQGHFTVIQMQYSTLIR